MNHMKTNTNWEFGWIWFTVVAHPGAGYHKDWRALCYQKYEHHEEEEVTPENTFKRLDQLVAVMTLKNLMPKESPE